MLITVISFLLVFNLYFNFNTDDAFGSTTNLNNIFAETNNFEQTNKEMRLDNASAMVSNLNELNILNENNNNKLNIQLVTDTQKEETITNVDKVNNIDAEFSELSEQETNQIKNDVEVSIDNLNENPEDPLPAAEEMLVEKHEFKKEDKENSIKIMLKNSARTRINKQNEDSSFIKNLDPIFIPNKSHFNFHKNRITINTCDFIDNKKAENEMEINHHVDNFNEEKNLEEIEKLEKIKRLEELELNEDLTDKENSIKKEESEKVKIKNEIEAQVENEKNELISQTSKKNIANNNLNLVANEIKNESIRNSSNKDLNNVENKIFECNILTKNTSQADMLSHKNDKSNKDLIITLTSNDNKSKKDSIASQKHPLVEQNIQASKTNLLNENYSKYFEASNQNFSSSVGNFYNSNNNNILMNSTKNVILGSDLTGNTYNVFSLTTVNNFNSNNLNIAEVTKFDQSPIKENSKISIEALPKKPIEIANDEIHQNLNNEKISKERNLIKTVKKSSPNKNKNKSKEKKHELFDSDEGDNYKSNDKI